MATQTTTVAPLERDAVGLPGVLFQSMTSMAPAAAIAASIPLGAAFAAGALPLAVLFAFIGILFTAWSIGQLAKHIPAAGSVATYSAAGLAPWVGFLVGWGYTAMQVLVLPLVMLQLGFTVAGEWHAEQSSFPTSLWWVFTTAGTLLVCYLVYRGVRTSTRTGVWLGSIEIVVFLGLAIALVVKAGSNNTLQVFTTHFATVKGYTGMSGVVAAGVGALLAFAGFESAAALAEEARHPRRNIPRAVLFATVLIGALYVFTTYAAAVGYGPGKLAGFASASNGVPWSGLARTVANFLWVFVLLAIINSTLACANANTNVFTRTGYALGRIGVMPSGLSNLHPRFHSPRVGVLVELLIGLAVTLTLGERYSPEVAFGIVGTAIVVVIVPIYIVANIACIGYYLRNHREERNVVSHIVVPIIGAAALVPGFLSVAGITGVPGLKFITALTSPYKYAPYVMAAWILAGVVMLFVLRARNPQAINAVAHIHLDDEVLPPMAAATPIRPEETEAA
ncbi:MAG TPA: APC family permease [Thermoleophilia bacterium]|nr:APC family permease [Thermoleophilia bacterium]